MLRSVKLTVNDLLHALNFEVDCTIASIDRTARAEVRQLVKPGDRVCQIGENSVMQRSGLAAALSGKAANEIVDVEIMEGNDEMGDASIEGSVLLDGKDCSITPLAVAPKVKDELEVSSEDDTPPERPQGLPSDSAVKLAKFNPGVSGAAEKPEEELRTALERGLVRTTAGRCLILLTDPEVSPLAEIENLSGSRKLDAPTVVDFGLRIKHRISDKQLVDAFRSTMVKGSWFVIERATKSIHLLALVSQLLEECHNNQLRDVSDSSRIIIVTEPHPHFPPYLTHGAVTVRVKKSLARSAVLFESILNESTRKLAAIQDQQNSPNADQVKPEAKRVRISCAVNVVDIESREVFDENVITSQLITKETAGAIKLRHTASALPNDKFFALARAGKKRFAAGSSLGNLYVVDDKGAALLSAHVHNASLWDCDFFGKTQFATAAEDCTAVSWRYDNDNNVERVATVRGPRDMYCVRFTGDGSALVSGGLDPQMIIKTLSGSTGTTRVPLSGSVQAMAARGSASVVIGGGEGSAYIVDIACQKVQHWKGIHAKKVPSICLNGDTLITGSFDATAKLWDIRKGCDTPIHSLKFKQYVTGLDCDGNYLTGCVGDCLYLWDTRKLDSILGGCAKAWAGLSRAVKIDAEDSAIVTASPDGLIRYWSF